jgi:hypothetical protein
MSMRVTASTMAESNSAIQWNNNAQPIQNKTNIHTIRS